MRRTLLPFAIAATAAVVSSQTPPSWINPFDGNPTANRPSLRRAGAMGFDGVNNRMILYGGVSPTPSQILSETWAYNGTWTLLNPVGGSLPRWGHQLVRDTAQNRLITFGGRSPTISGLANDTYAWTGTAWTAVPSPTAPAARFRYGLAYDSNRNRVVLFGGRGLADVLDDTWEFDGVTWTELTPASSPLPREDMVLAYDPGLRRTVLFGGYDPATDTLHGDTWEWDGSAWQQVQPTTSPSARFRAAGTLDSIRQRVVMYGGFDGTNILQETWEYLGGVWNQVSTGGTAFATEMYAGYDRQRRKFVTFGGVGAAFSNETWEFTGGTAGALGTYGTGCPTSVGIAFPTTTAVAKLGQNYTIDWMNLPATTTEAYVGYGVSNVLAFGVLPLPIDLGLIGYAGCDLWVSPDAVQFVPATGGTASSSLAIPNDLTLLNVSLYAQLLVPDTFAPNTVGGASVGARSLIGN